MPLDIPGCVLWLRSDLDVIKDGSNLISEWIDQSDQGNIVSAPAGKEPLWVDAQLQGYPSVRFDGTNDYMATGVLALAQPLDVYVVFNQISWTGDDTVIDGLADYNTMRLYQATSSPYVQMYAGAPGPVQAPGVGTWSLIQCLFNGAASVMRLNGGNDASGNPGTAVPNGITLGRLGGYDGFYSNVEFVEIIIYNAALSNSQHPLVANYLKDRYAIY